MFRGRYWQTAVSIALLFSFVACTPTEGEAPDYVLAFSWQPAFCETRPRKKECRTQHADRFDAVHFSLHGLWPQPRSQVYCEVPKSEIDLDKQGKWRQLQPLELTQESRNELERVMPGSQSFLHRHEWLKHGTCHGGSAQDYFDQSLSLMRKLNGSRLRELFAANIGEELSGEEIREALDADFGSGAGERLRIACKRDGDRRLIVELTLGLTGVINDEPGMKQLIASAKPTDPGCPGGIVDPTGFQ